MANPIDLLKAYCFCRTIFRLCTRRVFFFLLENTITLAFKASGRTREEGQGGELFLLAIWLREALLIPLACGTEKEADAGLELEWETGMCLGWVECERLQLERLEVGMSRVSEWRKQPVSCDVSSSSSLLSFTVLAEQRHGPRLWCCWWSVMF